MELTTTNEGFIYKDQEGKVLLQADSFLDLFQYIALIGREIKQANPDLDNLGVAKLQTELINKEYNASLTWGNTVEVVGFLHMEYAKLKKKNCSQEQNSHTTST